MIKPQQADLLAEQRLLQTSYNQPEFLDQITEDLFSTRSNQNIFNSIIYLKDNEIPFTRDALFQQYLTRDLDGNATVIDIISKPSNNKLLSINDIISQLKDFKKRREISSILEDVTTYLNQLSKIEPDDIEKIKDKLVQAEVTLASSDEKKKILNLTEWFDEYEIELNRRKSGSKLPFNNFIFDTLIPDGPRPGEMGILVSASGSGKSTVCLNLISDLIDAKIPCIYLSLEMSSIATLDRLCSKRIGIPYQEIVNPKEQNEYDGVLNAIQQEKEKLIKNNKFRFSEDANLSLADLYRHIKKFQADIINNYCVVVIDLLSMITDFCKTASNMAQQIEIGVNKLSAMSKELNVHIIGVLQYKRDAESEAGKIRDQKDLQKFRPNRAQIKNSGAWLERSRYIVSSFRPKMYAKMFLEEDEYQDMIDIIEISVLKINNAEIGKKIEAIFDGATFNITPFDDIKEDTNE
jgi:replicative DNA helicase